MNDLQVTRTPEMVAAEINLIKDQTRRLVLSNSIAIGKKLKEAKEMLEPGQFGKRTLKYKNVLLNWQQNVKIELCNHTLKVC